MSIFSSNYDWDKKDDDPLSTLINEDFTTRSRPSSERGAPEPRTRSATYSAEAGSRSSSSFLDNFLNEEQPINVPSESAARKSVKFDESSIAQTPSRKANNIDWLGIGEDEDDEANTRGTTSTNDVDWLTSGLNRRQQRRAQTGRNGTEAPATGSQPKSKPEKTSSKPSSSDMIADKNENEPVSAGETTEHLKSSEFAGELTVLRTKVSILEIEKQHLSESIDKLNGNHEQEVNLLKQLHEQQLNLMKTILADQEKLIKDERDRRVVDLQGQLDAMERYLEENRAKSNEKIKELEQEWFGEVQRLKTIHETTVGRLIEQHEQDLERLRKIKEREIETLQSFQTKFGNLDELLVKWQQNSSKMESLQAKLSIEQDKLLGQRLSDIDVKDKQIENIEQKWLQLADNLRSERDAAEQLKSLFVRTVEDQKQFVQKEREQLRDDRNEFENERNRFADERRQIELKLEKSRDLIDQTAVDQRKRDESLRAKEKQLNDQQLELMRKENEWRVNYERESDRLASQAKQLDKEQLRVSGEQNELKRGREALNAERKLFEQKKELFDKEKAKLEVLAGTIVKRSEELQELSETVNLDRKENERLFNESEKLKGEFDEKLKLLEANLFELKRRELQLERQSELVHREWQELQEAKLHVLCSLCSGSLNQGKPEQEKVDEFLNVLHSSNLYLNISENDRSLLIWQLTGQEEGALLEEETEFLKSLRK